MRRVVLLLVQQEKFHVRRGFIHCQEVNTYLPPTFAQPARYYLVFRNNSRANGKKLVQADFRVDF